MASRKSLSMPEIQRELVWKPCDVVNLLQSIANESSINQVHLWRLAEGEKIEIKSQKSSNAIAKEGDVLIIDGQQRITALAIVIARTIPDWCRADDPKVAAIMSRVNYDIVEARFANKKLHGKDGEGLISASDLFHLSDDALKNAIYKAAPAQYGTVQRNQFLDRALEARRKIRCFEVSADIRTMTLFEGLASFKNINLAGLTLDETDLLLASIAAHCPGLVSEQIRPYVATRPHGVKADTFMKAVVRTLICMALHRSGLETTSRLKKVDFTSIDPKVWKSAWRDTARAWARVFECLSKNGFDPSILPGLNPLVPLSLFALQFPEMYSTENEEYMVALFALCQRSERFAKHSTDPHEIDAPVILEASNGFDALTKLAHSILMVYARDNNSASPHFTAGELMDFDISLKSYKLFLSQWVWRRGAIDWETGARLHYAKSALAGGKGKIPLEFHHIVPIAFAKKTFGADIAKTSKSTRPGRDQFIDSVANMALLEAESNNKYSDIGPEHALAEVPIERLGQQCAAGLLGACSLEEAERLIRERAEFMAGPDQMNWFIALLEDLINADSELGNILSNARMSSDENQATLFDTVEA